MNFGITTSDPNFLKGATLIYNRELPFSFRYQQPNGSFDEINSNEFLKVSIYQWVILITKVFLCF